MLLRRQSCQMYEYYFVGYLAGREQPVFPNVNKIASNAA